MLKVHIDHVINVNIDHTQNKKFAFGCNSLLLAVPYENEPNLTNSVCSSTIVFVDFHGCHYRKHILTLCKQKYNVKSCN